MLGVIAAILAVSINAVPLPAPEPALSPSMRLFQGNNAVDDEDKGKQRRQKRNAAPGPQTRPPGAKQAPPKPGATPEKKN